MSIKEYVNIIQKVRDQVFRVRGGNTAEHRGQEGPGPRLPRRVLRLRPLQQEAGHRRRVLPDGGQEAALQDRLRQRQGKRLVCQVTLLSE